MIECPHWEPGKITLRNGCTACAAEINEAHRLRLNAEALRTRPDPKSQDSGGGRP